MTLLDGFQAVGEVVADDRRRIAFGKIGVRENERYAVSKNADGEILLTPLVSIPARELVVWENDELRASLARGLADVAAGNTVRLDWVTADPDADDE